MQEIFMVPLIFAFMAFGIWLTAWTFSRSRQLLERWAEENGYTILNSEFRWLRRGRFFWTSSKGQVIYYVTVRTREGHTRSGWVRCGGFFLGLLQDELTGCI